MIQAPGIGSGLDINSIVSQLMAFERRPLDLLENKSQSLEAQLSAYGQLKSSVASFQSAMNKLGSLDQFQIFAPTSSDENVVSATADGEAVEGSYSITVNRLAENHKLASTPFTDADTVVGEGTLTLAVGADSFQVTIDSSNSSLAGIRDAINSAADNTGVSATVINEDAGSRLILTAEDTGTANALTVTASNGGVGDLSQLESANLTEINAAVDAEFTIDDASFVVTSASNRVENALDGVTLNLNSLGSATLNVNRDDEAIQNSLQNFADSFNALRDAIQTHRDGQLEAEGTLLSIESQLLGVLNQGNAISNSNYRYLSEVGLSVDKEGHMQLDSSALESALKTDFRSFSNLFAATDEGYAFRFEAVANALLESDGLIDAREDGLNTQIRRLEDQQGNIEFRLEQTERRIRAQFTALDTLVSNFTATGNFLSQQLSSLVGNSGS